MFFKRISQNYLDNTGVVNNRNDDDNDAFHPLHVYRILWNYTPGYNKNFDV